jgi:hypothetical protein
MVWSFLSFFGGGKYGIAWELGSTSTVTALVNEKFNSGIEMVQPPRVGNRDQGVAPKNTTALRGSSCPKGPCIAGGTIQ